MFLVETSVRARGGRIVWVRKGTFESRASAMAAFGHLIGGCYASQWRVTET